MLINFNQPSNFNITAPKSFHGQKYPNLAPLKQDTVTFGCKNFVRPKDLMDLKEKDIIQVCLNALDKKQTIGKGTEATVYKIPEYAMQYCLREENNKITNKNKLKTIHFNRM